MKRAFLLLIASSSGLAAQPAEPPEAPLVIRNVAIERTNVFDPAVPGEDWWGFRIANRIHIPTIRRVILHENLLPPGSRWDPIKALETERNLRSLGFIRNAEVRTTAAGPGKLDLKIRTQDSWTLKPTFSFGTEGGDNFLVYGIEENNILGLGKSIRLVHSQKGSDIRNEASYVDPRVWGTWHRLTTLLAKTEEGDEVAVRTDKPFFSFETKTASNFSWARINRVDILYDNAEEVSKFNHNFHTVRSELARRVGSNNRLISRIHIGTIYERQRFFSKKETAAGTLPADRTISGPLIGFSWIQPKYLKETNINSMARVEDFNLGNEMSAGLAPTLGSWGSDRDRVLFSGTLQQGLAIMPGRFLLAQVGTQGRVAGGDRLENAHFFANLNIFWKYRRLFPQTLIAHLEFNNAKNLDKEKQIILGGTTGLRGYKANSFTGGRSILLNLEDRFFYDREFLHLIYLGGVAFFDIGAVSPAGRSFRFAQFKSDLGFGLRISPSRSSTGVGLRIDLAYALNDGPGNSRWVLSVKAGQAFSIFNSSNRELLVQPDEAITGDDNKNRLIRQ